MPEVQANAELIMASVLKCGRNEVRLQASSALDEKLSHHFWTHVRERGKRVPLAYILGFQNFMGLDIAVTPAVLIPRPETEELVEEAQKQLKSLGRPSPVVLEIGTGSACVAVALAKMLPDATIYATEISPAALSLALKNAEAHGVSRRIRFVKEDLFKPASQTSGWADLLISNPPYIRTGEIKKLSAEVQNEPVLALDGGKDGLDALRAIISDAPRLLKPGGWLVLEIDAEQGAEVLKILKSRGFLGAAVRKDAQGLDRIAEGKMVN